MSDFNANERVWMDQVVGIEAAQVPVVVRAGGPRPVVTLRNGAHVTAAPQHLHREPNRHSPGHWARA